MRHNVLPTMYYRVVGHCEKCLIDSEVLVHGHLTPEFCTAKKQGRVARSRTAHLMSSVNQRNKRTHSLNVYFKSPHPMTCLPSNDS